MKIPNPAYGLASSDPLVQQGYEGRVSALLDAGYCSLGAFQDALFPKLYRSVCRPQECRNAKANMEAFGFYNFRVEPEIWMERIADFVEQAVINSKLPLFAWPAIFAEDGHYEIAAPPQSPKLIHAEILKLVRSDHGGLPATFLGIRPVAIAKLLERGIVIPNCNDLVVVKLEQAAQFVETERRKGSWPTQQGNGRELKSSRRGRPRDREKLVGAMKVLIAQNKWDGSKSIPRLVGMLEKQTGDKNLSADTVRRSVDDLYAITADNRLHRTFGRRNTSNRPKSKSER